MRPHGVRDNASASRCSLRAQTRQKDSFGHRRVEAVQPALFSKVRPHGVRDTHLPSQVSLGDRRQRADDRSSSRSRSTSAGSRVALVQVLGMAHHSGPSRTASTPYIGGGCLSSRSSTVGGEACMYICRQHSAGTVVSRSEERPWLPVLLSFFSCPACRQRRHFGVADATGVPRSRHSMVHA